MTTIGLVAGGGDLPTHVVKGARVAGHDIVVARLTGQTDMAYDGEVRDFPLAAFGSMTKWFSKHGVAEVCLAGNVERPDFGNLKPDAKGVRALPAIIRAARKGDEALLRAVAEAFEREGFTVVPPQSLASHLLAPEGNIGRMEVPNGARYDILKACEVAREMGRLDIGQAAVVCDGLVLAVEAQEGTAAMLQRVAALPESIRGTLALRNGILAKMLKPGQDARTDLPTIGPDTVRLASAAGLAGIVVEAANAFVIDRDEVAQLGDDAGIFVVGLPQA